MPKQADPQEQVNRYVEILRFMMIEHDKWINPTIREIGAHMGWTSSSTTAGHLRAMKDWGLISGVYGKPRTTVITEQGRALYRRYGGNDIDHE